MGEHLSLPGIELSISRRGLLRGGLAAAALAALASCDGAGSPHAADSPHSAGSPKGTGSADSAGSPSRVGANVRVSNDRYREHIGPSLAANPRDPRQLLVACQASPAFPELVVTYISSDGGASWQNGGLPPRPAAGPAGDDVTVAFDTHGRGYVCATRSGHASNLNPANANNNRAVYVWRTDDGGRSFSAPVTVVEGQYADHPWIATGGQTPAAHDVYVAWSGGNSHTALDLARSDDGGQSFAAPRRILAGATAPSLVAANPQLAAGPGGLVCAVCDWTSQRDSSGDIIGEVVAVCSTDAGHSFAAPVHLGSDSSVIALPSGARPDSGPTVAASVQGDALYVAFPKHQPRATHSDIVVTASYDHGRTWTKTVTATPDDDVIYFQPNLAVDAEGRVAISAFALAKGRVDEVLLVSRPQELRFYPPVRVTTAPFNPLNPATASRGKEGTWWIGDWQGITASPGAFHLVWNDTRTGKLDLYAATVRS